MERAKGLGPEQKMPKVSGENVEKPDGRKNRSGQSLLKLDVVVDDFRIGEQADSAQVGDIAAIQTFIDAQTLHFWFGMKRLEKMNRAAWLGEDRVRHPQKDSDAKHDQNTGDLYPAPVQFGRTHGVEERLVDC